MKYFVALLVAILVIVYVEAQAQTNNQLIDDTGNVNNRYNVTPDRVQRDAELCLECVQQPQYHCEKCRDHCDEDIHVSKECSNCVKATCPDDCCQYCCYNTTACHVSKLH